MLAEYSGKWIAFDHGQVVASGSDFSEVLDQAGRRGHPLAYIDCVGAEGETRFRSRRVEFSYDLDYAPTALPQATVTFANFAGREVMNRMVVTFDGPARKVIFED